ncbi:MAG: glycosyltransferase [Actinomycetia bacterium]|nr:glycosyltransferase [Actinomycetes bacterium]
MRIGLVSYDFYPPIGGQGVEAYELYKALQNQEEVDVVVFSSRENDIPCHIDVPTVNALGVGQFHFSLKVGGIIRDLDRKNRIDLLQVYGGPGGVLIYRKPPVPLVFVANHTYGQQYRYLGKKAYRLLMRVEGRGYRLADRIVAISTTTRDSLINDYGIPPDKVRVIPVGVDTNRFRPLGIERIPHSILYVGRLCERKGIPLLIDSLKDAKVSIPDIRLYIVGEGELKSKLQDHVERMKLSENVVFLGRVSGEELVKWYNRVEVMVVPSIFEGFGIVCIEAMACGTPVIATECPGVVDIIDDKRNGILVNRNRSELAGAITELLGDKELRNAMARAGREDVIERFSWNVIVEKFVKVYRQASRPSGVDSHRGASGVHVSGEGAADQDDYYKLAELFKEKGYRRICIVTTRFPPYPEGVTVLRGGIDSDVGSMVEALRESGLAVTVAALDYVKEVPEPRGSPVRRIGTYRPYALEKNMARKTVRLLTSETFRPVIFIKLLSLLRGERPDAMILVESLQLSLTPHLVSRMTGVPIYIRNDWICPARPDDEVCGFWRRVLGCGDCLEVKMGTRLGRFSGYAMGVFSALMYLAKSRLWRKVAGALPVSEYVIPQFTGYGVPPNSVTVIRPTRRIERFPVSERPFTELEEESSLKVLFMGRLEKDKGIDVLLDAFERAVVEREDLKLLVAGEGIMRPLVEEAASRVPQVTFLGWLDEKGVSQAYQVADVVIIPTIIPESHGVVAEEAISYRKLIVGPLSGGLKEMLETYPDSISLDEVSVDSLYETILSLAMKHVEKSETPTG